MADYFESEIMFVQKCYAQYVIKLSRNRQRHVVARMHLHKPLNFTVAAKVIAEMVNLFKFSFIFLHDELTFGASTRTTINL